MARVRKDVVAVSLPVAFQEKLAALMAHELTYRAGPVTLSAMIRLLIGRAYDALPDQWKGEEQDGLAGRGGSA